MHSVLVVFRKNAWSWYYKKNWIFFTKVSTIFNSSYIYNAITRLKLKLPLKCSSDRPFGLRGPWRHAESDSFLRDLLLWPASLVWSGRGSVSCTVPMPGGSVLHWPLALPLTFGLKEWSAVYIYINDLDQFLYKAVSQMNWR